MRLPAIVWALVLAVTAGPGPASAGPPPEVMEDRALAFVEAFNSGDADRYGLFREQHWNTADAKTPGWPDKYLSLHGRTGRLEVQSVRVGDETVVVVAVPERDYSEVGLTFRFEDAPPYRIASLQLALQRSDDAPRRADLPELAVDATMKPARLRETIDRYLANLEERDVFSGTAYIAKDGEVLYSDAFGEASKSFAVPNTPATRFRVGSITKDFTKVALARLVIEGRMRPDDTILDHLPDYPNAEAAAAITVDQLVGHRSGLGGMNFREFSQLAKVRFREPADYIELFARTPLLFEPGTSREYSNAGYIVLGAMMAAASGMSYNDCIQKYVFDPAGMSRSLFVSLDKPCTDIAVGYWKCDPNSDEWCNNYHTMEIDGGPSGGSYSTAEDLYRFDVALRGNRLLPAAYTNWFFTGEWPSTESDVTDTWPPFAGAGGAEGVNAVYASDGRWFIAVLCNYDGSMAEEIGLRLYEGLVGPLVKP